MLYEVEVTEVRHYRVQYLVEARSQEEAERKAEVGETEHERDVKMEQVSNRVVFSSKKSRGW